ncbi:MAG: sigma-70 family RNA polymerase sigma factor [Lachnospiraceae bacterium]|nr:sigma-70 family RNA polymerase sigma factor [Lachnospiraceae bacterium]
MCNMGAEELFENYSDMVYRVALMSCGDRSAAEDIVQEVFVRYLKNKPEFENAEHAKAWFIRVSVNCAKSQLTSFWKRNVVPVEEFFESENDLSQTTFSSDESELFEVIRSLPQKYSIVIYLRYYEEYAVNEIAKILHTTAGTISSRLTRARKLLKEQLSKEGYSYYERDGQTSVAQNV